jgi:hypothetical protein
VRRDSVALRLSVLLLNEAWCVVPNHDYPQAVRVAGVPVSSVDEHRYISNRQHVAIR